MNSDLTNFYVQNNFEYKENIHYGIYRNFVISIVQDIMSTKVSISFNEPLPEEKAKTIATSIREIKQKYRPLQNALVFPVYLQIIYFNGSDLVSSFAESLDEIINIIERNYTFEIGKCPLCGKPLATNDPFLKVGDYVMQAHDQCADGLCVETQDLVKKSEESFKGKNQIITVAILLGLFITIVLLNSVLAKLEILTFIFLSGWLVIIAAKLLFTKLKMPLIKKVVRSVLTTSIITLVVSEILSLFIYTMSSNGISLDVAFNNIAMILANSYLNIILDLVFGAALIGLAMIPLYRAVKNVSSGRVKKL